MHTVERLDEAIALAEQWGYIVRQEWLGGAAGGVCVIRGQSWIFIDLSLTPGEQCEQVLSALREDHRAESFEFDAKLRKFLKPKRAA